MLSESTAMIGWLDEEMERTTYDSWVYCIRSSGPVVWARLGRASTEGGEVSPLKGARSFRKDLADPDSPAIAVRRGARDLWEERVGPLQTALEGVEDLVVIPSGAMLGVPVEALVNQWGVPLREQYAVSYVPSATIHTWLTERGAEQKHDVGGRALLLGDPPFAGAHLTAIERERGVAQAPVATASSPASLEVALLRGALAGNRESLGALPRLPGTREEIATVAAVYPDATVLMGPQASEEEIVRLAESGVLHQFETIHLATHAFVDDEHPERSALVLSQVNLPDPLSAAMAGMRIYDGLLSAKEIVREWRLDADLVTLSACETGLGEEIAGEGYIGLAHAFLRAGARSLLVSLWKVEDRATSLLMQRFYENRAGAYEGERAGCAGKAMSKAEALQEAKNWLRTYTDEYGRRPYEHPYYWSAFILIGERG
jgi:CHAT domain-containing protein